MRWCVGYYPRDVAAGLEGLRFEHRDGYVLTLTVSGLERLIVEILTLKRHEYTIPRTKTSNVH